MADLKMRQCVPVAGVMLLCTLFVGLAAGYDAAPRGSATVEPVGTIERTALAFIESIAAGKYDEACKPLDATMKQALPSAKLGEIWRTLETGNGAFRTVTGLRTEDAGPHRMVFVTCQFANAALDAKVVFSGEQISGLWFVPVTPAAAPATDDQSDKPLPVPDYADPSRYEEREVQVGTDPWVLPGTLTLPTAGRPCPAVVLIHGSGPNDRDETIGPNKPFRDLAWGLASRGIAVLRYDKRTFAHRERLVSEQAPITVKEETVDDSLAAVALLKTTPEVDARRIFVAGHSLGGMLVPKIAARAEGVAGYIIMAGTTRPLDEVLLEQMNYIYSVDGNISPEEKKQLGDIESELAKIKAADPGSSGKELILGAPLAYWRDLQSYDAAAAARAVREPMLILQGGRDYQVTGEDFEGWKRALQSRPDVQFELYPALSHLFIAGEGKSTPQTYAIPGHVAGEVVKDIAQWIRRTAQAP